MVTLEDLSEPVGEFDVAKDWNEEGVVILPEFMPDELIDAYSYAWGEANGFHGVILPSVAATRSRPGHPDETTYSQLAPVLDAERSGGWPDCTPYRRHVELRDFFCYGPLASVLEGLLGEPAGTHLNLTGWVTTARRWHQDTYLNPWFVGDHYAAVWFALGDVHPDSGPFQYIPGSHRWHRLLQDEIALHVNMKDPEWPKHTEDFLTPLVEKRIADGAEVVTHLPKKGDVLIWHSRLYHQGSPANVEGAYRPAAIAHYSGIYHRQDMPRAERHGEGWYFPVDGGPV